VTLGGALFPQIQTSGAILNEITLISLNSPRNSCTVGNQGDQVPLMTAHSYNYTHWLKLSCLLVIAWLLYPTDAANGIGPFPTSRLACALNRGAGEVHAHRISLGRLFEVCPLDPSASNKLIPNSLIVQPGRYQLDLDGQRISIEAKLSGLYQIYVPGGPSRQFIVRNQLDSPEQLLRDIAGLYAHGTRDDTLDMSALLVAAQTRTLSLTCGGAVRLTRELLVSQGIKSREVFTLTHERQNGVDDGHILLEIKDLLGWKLYDPDLKVKFTSKKKSLDSIDVARTPSTQIGRVIVSYAPEYSNRLDYGSLVDYRDYDFIFISFRTPFNQTTIQAWYQRILGSFGRWTDEGPVFWEPNSAKRNRVLLTHPTARFVSATEFRRA